MDSKHPSSPDFSFAFNDSNFSDRILRIEIMAEPPDKESDSEDCNTVAEWAKKRKRYWGENSDEAAHNNDSHTVTKIKLLHITSALLAAKSPFFYKCFQKESEKREATIRISETEEIPFMDMLNFVYSGMLSATTSPALLDVLVTADRFEVSSCVQHCCMLLRNLPMTPECALAYLEIPFKTTNAIKYLIDAAKQSLARCYKQFTHSQKEKVMTLPLVGMEAVLSSNELQVVSEDAVFEFLLKWARAKYPDLEERRKVLSMRIARLIRFPYMTTPKLREVLICNDLDDNIASKLVLDALLFKSETPYHQHRYVHGRAYTSRPVKVIELEPPQCVVFLNLSRAECQALYPEGHVESQVFHLRGTGFYLSAKCSLDEQNSRGFALFLGMVKSGSVNVAVDFKFSAWSKEAWDYVNKGKATHTFNGDMMFGYRNLFQMPWTAFLADDNPYFMTGMLYLRAEVTIRPL
ncbi:hypothetical protein AMTRI_Chr01g129580 [Amborella trichopoda]